MGVIQSVIMAGGLGARLWPVSKPIMPKQFIKFFDGKSLLQLTLERNKEFAPMAVMAQEKHRFIVKEQIEEIGIKADIIIEPIAKSTAPCAIIASLYAKKKKADTVILLPVDHFIRKKKNYTSMIKRAIDVSDNENIVTFGIRPYKAHPGYGYLKAGTELSQQLFEIEKFVEKPHKALAAEYIREGSYYWNSGIFVFKPESLIKIAAHLDPAMYNSSLNAFNSLKHQSDFLILDPISYRNIRSNSIDYAFMERKTTNITMLYADFLWNDLGNWSGMWEAHYKDKNGNVIQGKTFVSETTRSYIYSKNKFTTVIGVDDLIIVNTDDASLVMHKSKADSLGKLIKFLNDKEQ